VTWTQTARRARRMATSDRDKQLIGHVDNSAFSNHREHQATVSAPANATGPVPVVLSFGAPGFGFGRGRGAGADAEPPAFRQRAPAASAAASASGRGGPAPAPRCRRPPGAARPNRSDQSAAVARLGRL
jgi:hypothetical protein